MKKHVEFTESKRIKFKSYYEMTNQWISLKNEGKSLEGYFLKNGYKTIAIYGMGEMGNRLYEELSNSETVKVLYAMDENANGVYSDIQILTMDDEWEEVDVIVVSAIFDFEDIYGKLAKRTNSPIISLEDVVFESF